MELELLPPFDAAWKDKDPFAAVDAIDGDVYRQLEARRTLRFEFEGRGYFLKSHKGVGWLEICKNLLLLRLPILGAANERRAIAALEAAGVGTMKLAAFGQRGQNPAAIESFIITESIEPSLSLEDLAIEWRTHPPALAFKRKLMTSVCEMSRAMHHAGVNHRDFYICHFLLQQPINEEEPQLRLIDLHRALIHRQLPARWRIKDLAGLYFSVLDIPLTRTDRLRFIRDYSGKSLRSCLSEDAAMWQKVERKAQALYERAKRKGMLR